MKSLVFVESGYGLFLAEAATRVLGRTRHLVYSEIESFHAGKGD